MVSLKELLSKKNSDNFESDFLEHQRLSLQMLNQLANENSQLKKSLEDKTSETIGIKSENQLENSWPEGFSGHPTNPQVPIRKKGRNGREWEHYRDLMQECFYLDEIQEVATIMATQGFLDSDILDAFFPCADGSRRMSLHNYNALLGVIRSV